MRVCVCYKSFHLLASDIDWACVLSSHFGWPGTVFGVLLRTESLRLEDVRHFRYFVDVVDSCWCIGVMGSASTCGIDSALTTYCKYWTAMFFDDLLTSDDCHHISSWAHICCFFRVPATETI